MRIKAIVILLLTALFCLQSAQAADATGFVQLQVVDPILISEDRRVSFGPMLLGVGTCTMASDGTLTTTGKGCLRASGTPGQVTVTGTPGAYVAVNLAAGVSNNVTFTPANNSGGWAQLSGDGTLTFNVYGKIEQAAGATTGATSVSYIIDINY